MFSGGIHIQGYPGERAQVTVIHPHESSTSVIYFDY